MALEAINITEFIIHPTQYKAVTDIIFLYKLFITCQLTASVTRIIQHFVTFTTFKGNLMKKSLNNFGGFVKHLLNALHFVQVTKITIAKILLS